MPRSRAVLALTCGALITGTLAAASNDPWSTSCSSAKSAPESVQWAIPAEAGDIIDTAVGAGKFNTLAAALKAAGLIDALKGPGPFTVFAPTDEAFAKLPKGTVENLLKPENKALLTSILTYHVVSGKAPASAVISRNGWITLSGQRIDIAISNGKVMVDNAAVTQADIMASNGVIHVIDTVILPETKNIVEIASGAKTFGTLLAAVKAAGLADVLMGEGPFTVLAPTDEAFSKLPPGTVESLLKPENREKLVAILTYHVIPGRAYAKDAVAAETAATIEGSKVRFRVVDGRLTASGANVVATDIEASNGVIHVIDAVIMPGLN
ncbi:MAG: fasciclin domain-containing protein [Phycisphaeraceae bacterium]|nr:MAG: fasciclin domain-containing protein [Phycisphaeraceae bacterium]